MADTAQWPPGTPRWKRLSLLLCGVVCCFLFVGFGYQHNTSDDGTLKREEIRWTLGLPFSPWWEHTKIVEDDSRFRTEWGVNILSWSWLLLIAGTALLRSWRRSQPLRKTPQRPDGSGIAES